MSKQVAVQLMQASELSKLIGQIGRASAKLMVQIQIAAVQCVAQSIVHRNATPAMQLFEVIAGTRRDALVAYFEKFGNLTWSKAEKKVIFCDMEKIPNGRKLEWTAEYAETVAATSWLSTKKEAEPRSIFDVSEEAEKFLERLTKAKRKGVEIKNDALLERLYATYQQYVGEQYLKASTSLPTDEDVHAAEAAGDKVSAEKLRELQGKFGGRPTPVKKEGTPMPAQKLPEPAVAAGGSK